MAKAYAAFLRGIGPSNPNMRNEKLRGVFEGLGFDGVQSVISSGNIIFRSSQKKDVSKLEDQIEKALYENLGLKNAVIVRSQQQLQDLVKQDPFAGQSHEPGTYLTVTFLKHSLPKDFSLNPGRSSKIVNTDQNLAAIYAITDTTATKTPNFMIWLEKQFGRDITTRTYNTVQRILKKLDA